MSQSDVLRELQNNEAQIKKAFGNTQYAALKNYSEIKSGAEPFGFIGSSNKMKALDDLMSNMGQIGSGFSSLYKEFADGIATDINDAYTTSAALSKTRAKVSTLAQYGIQPQYSDSFEDRVAQSAGLAPASFDISPYLPEGMQPNDLMYTDEGTSAVLDSYTRQQKEQEAKDAIIAAKENKAAQIPGYTPQVEGTGQTGALGATQTGIVGTAINQQIQSEAFEDKYSNYDTESAASRIDALNAQYAQVEKNIQNTQYALDSDTTLTGDQYYGAEMQKYKSEAEKIQQEIALIKDDVQQAEYYDWMTYATATEFEQYAAIGASIENPTWGEGKGFLGGTKPVQNEVTFYLENTKAGGEEAYEYLTGKETDVYNYLLALDKTQNTNNAAGFLDFMAPILSGRKMGELTTTAAEDAKNYPVLSSIGSVLLAPATGIGYAKAGITNLTGGDVDPNDIAFLPSRAQQTIRSEVSEDMSDAGAFLYNTGMSIGDFLITTGVSGGSQAAALTMMSTSAATSATLDALDRGATQEQALTYGFFTGAAEAVFEKFSLGNFMKIAKGSGGQVVKNILKQAGIEASEEMATEIANMITDAAVMGDMSKYNLSVDQYIKQGMSQQEAEQQASIDAITQVGLSGLGGALSGGVTGGGGVAISSISNNNTAQTPFEIPVDEFQSVETDNGDIAIPELPEPENIFSQNTQPENIFMQDNGENLSAPQENTQQGTKVHLTAESLQEVYKGTEVGDIINAEIKSGKASYTPESPAQNIEKSLRDVENGVITAKNYDSVLNRNGDIKRYNKADVADIAALLYDAETRGDTETAEKLRAALYDAGLQLGRGTQAFAAAYALLRKSSPSVFLLSAQKEIARVNATGQKKFKAWTDIELTAEETAAILNAQTFESRTEEYSKAQKRMQESMPSTTWEKLDQIRKTGMLFNLKTQARNVGGNLANEAMNAVARKIEAGFQKLIPKDQRTVAGFTKPEYKTMIEGEWANAQDAYKNSGRYNIESKFGDAYQQAFKNAGLGKAMNNLSKATGWLLDNRFFGDMAFGKHHYEAALASFAQARGLTEITNEARTFAMQRALEATFRADSKVASLLNKLIKETKGGKVLSVVMPFVKTPINIAKQSFDYSALGLGKSLLVDTFRVRGGQLSATEYIHNLSKGLTGTAISVIGFMLAKGLLIDGVKITGGAPDDKDEEAFLRAQGWQPYSLQIGDAYVPISWAQPVASTLLMGVKVAEITETTDNLDTIEDPTVWETILQAFDVVYDTGGAMLDSVADISPLSGVQKTLQYNDNIGDIGVGIASDLAGQFVPALAKQITQTIDPNIYDQHTSNPLETVKNQYATGFGLAGIDGMDVAQKVNPWGQPITQPDNVAARAGMNFLSPANLTFGTQDDVNEEIARLYDATGESMVFPNVYDTREIKTNAVLEITGEPITLSAKDLQQMQESIGQAARVLVEGYINSDQYKTDSDAVKAKTISGFYTDSKNLFELSKAYDLDFEQVASKLSAQADAYFSGTTEYGSPVPDAALMAGEYLNGIDKPIADMLTGYYEQTGNNIFLLNGDTFKQDGTTYEYPTDIAQTVVDGYEDIDGLGDIVSSPFFQQEDEAAQEKIIRDAINSIMNAVEEDTVREVDPLATVQQKVEPDTSTYDGFNDYWKDYGTDDKVIQALDEWAVYPNNSQSFSDQELLEGSHDWSDNEQQLISDTTYAALTKYFGRLDPARAKKIIDRVYLTFKNYVVAGQALNRNDILNDVYAYMDEKYEW